MRSSAYLHGPCSHIQLKYILRHLFAKGPATLNVYTHRFIHNCWATYGIAFPFLLFLRRFLSPDGTQFAFSAQSIQLCICTSRFSATVPIPKGTPSYIVTSLSSTGHVGTYDDIMLLYNIVCNHKKSKIAMQCNTHKRITDQREIRKREPHIMGQMQCIKGV